MQVVSDSWKIQIRGSLSFIWEEKIKRLKHYLKDWERLITSAISGRKKGQPKLETHQIHMDASPVSECLLRKEGDLQKAFFSACRLEEEYWRQKS